mmetsp:Transcript_17534/g.42808  ORF Transcript_17534/g.42808 Transcript_17534/m.42808 type:complete len:247 (+) Transcript_17534:431-1171(+)
MVFARLSNVKKEKKELPPILQGSLITKKRKPRRGRHPKNYSAFYPTRGPKFPKNSNVSSLSNSVSSTISNKEERGRQHKDPSSLEYHVEVLRRQNISNRGFGRNKFGNFVPASRIDDIDPRGFQSQMISQQIKRERFLPCKIKHKISIDPKDTGQKAAPVSKSTDPEKFRFVSRRGASRDPYGGFFSRPGQEPVRSLDLDPTMRALRPKAKFGERASNLVEQKLTTKPGYKRQPDGRIYYMPDSYL